MVLGLSALSASAIATPTPLFDRGSTASSPNPGFDISAVEALAVALPSHSWEFGTASEALLELWNSSLSVFGPAPFEAASQLSTAISVASIPSLAYAQSNIVLSTGANVLQDGDGAVGDPASLGVSAILLGKLGNDTLKAAAAREAEYLLTGAPRFWNGAISQRSDYSELW